MDYRIIIGIIITFSLDRLFKSVQAVLEITKAVLEIKVLKMKKDALSDSHSTKRLSVHRFLLRRNNV